MSHRIEIECVVDVEHSPESLHAHAIPEGCEIQPGDTVIVHDAPRAIAFNHRVQLRCRATVIKAGPLGRLWAYLSGLLEITELYEVGFQARRV